MKYLQHEIVCLTATFKATFSFEMHSIDVAVVVVVVSAFVVAGVALQMLFIRTSIIVI